VREVIAEYLRLLAEKEEPKPAEPAPDSEIRPPDPEPDNVFELVPKQRFDAAVPEDDPRYSWLFNAAVETLTKARMPESLRNELITWNANRCAAIYSSLLIRGTSWRKPTKFSQRCRSGRLAGRKAADGRRDPDHVEPARPAPAAAPELPRSAAGPDRPQRTGLVRSIRAAGVPGEAARVPTTNDTRGEMAIMGLDPAPNQMHAETVTAGV
jgi:hypothetical protein